MPILVLLSQTIEGVKIQTKAPNFKFLLNKVFDSIFIYFSKCINILQIKKITTIPKIYFFEPK